MSGRFWWGVGAVALVAAGAGGFFFYSTGKAGDPKYRLVKVERGDVTATVAATGTLSAVTTVKVGSQVSGIISKLHADFNSTVRRGQVLAELDPTTFQAQLDQRRADVEKTRVELRNAGLGFERAKKLLGEKLVSQSEYEAAELNFGAAKASVSQSEAAMRQAATNLGYTRIASPIDGVVVERQYDIGQTVAASFQAPTLFTIAQDLTKMQVLINVDEADVGRIKLGLAARFTVDAFPDRKFEGRISQIRLAPQTVQNVVTYPVLLDVSNPELELKPGMTANVAIPVETKTAVLRIPNAALRFRPDPADLPAAAKSAAAAPSSPSSSSSPAAAATSSGGKWGGGGEDAGRGGRRSNGEGNGARRGEGRSASLYVLDAGGKLRAVTARTSITDGNYTAAESSELKEGDSVVAGLATTKAPEQSGGIGGQGRRGGGMR